MELFDVLVVIVFDNLDASPIRAEKRTEERKGATGLEVREKERLSSILANRYDNSSDCKDFGARYVAFTSADLYHSPDTTQKTNFRPSVVSVAP